MHPPRRNFDRNTAAWIQAWKQRRPKVASRMLLDGSGKNTVTGGKVCGMTFGQLPAYASEHISAVCPSLFVEAQYRHGHIRSQTVVSPAVEGSSVAETPGHNTRAAMMGLAGAQDSHPSPGNANLLTPMTGRLALAALSLQCQRVDERISHSGPTRNPAATYPLEHDVKSLLSAPSQNRLSSSDSDGLPKVASSRPRLIGDDTST